MIVRSLLPWRSFPSFLLFLAVFHLFVPVESFPQESAQTSTPGDAPLDVQSASPAVVEKQLFLPSEYYVGDRVELRLTLSGGEGVYTIPSRLPEASWVTIHEIHIMPERDRSELVLEFTSFMPGTRTLPLLDLGGAILGDVKIHTSSILEDTSAPFAEPREQLLLPGTLGGLIVFGFALFLGPVVVLFIASRGRRWLLLLGTLRRERLPRRRFYRDLKKLQEEMATLTGREFYLLMDSMIRRYLAASVSPDFSSATGREYRELSKIHFRKRDFAAPLIEMSRFSELVKFGGHRAPYRKKEEHLALAGNLVEELERSRREERKAAGRRSR